MIHVLLDFFEGIFGKESSPSVVVIEMPLTGWL